MQRIEKLEILKWVLAELLLTKSRNLCRLGVLISGTGSNLLAIIKNCEAKKLSAEVVVVLSDKENASGIDKAKQYNIPTHVALPTSFDSSTAYYYYLSDLLKQYRCDLIILAGYLRILPPVFIHDFKDRILNIHPSLLPSFPGLHAQQQALDYGVKVSGCTVHFVTDTLDNGPIILQKSVCVEAGDTAASLGSRILTYEHQIYSEAIQLYCENRLSVSGRSVVIS